MKHDRGTLFRLGVTAAVVVVLAGCANGSSPSLESEATPSDSASAEQPIVTSGDLSADISLQNQVDEILRSVVPDTEGRFVAAVAVIDVPSGEVVAYGESSPISLSMLDTQRPSGSTLKLVVNVAAAELGVTADDGVVGGQNCIFPDGISAEPHANSQIAPVMSVRDATSKSVNCAFAKLTRSIGAARLGDTARALGFERELDLATNFAFGANTVSMRELATVAVTILNGGYATRIYDRQDQSSIEGARVLLQATPGHIADMTRDVLTSGTAQGNSLDGRASIAKTGTSENNTDAWIFGGTPQFAAVVWMGNPASPSDSMSNEVVPGFPLVRGGNLPAAIFRDVLNAAHRGLPALELASDTPSRPPAIVVDPTVDCQHGNDETYVGGDGPQIPWVLAGVPVTC